MNRSLALSNVLRALLLLREAQGILSRRFATILVEFQKGLRLPGHPDALFGPRANRLGHRIFLLPLTGDFGDRILPSFAGVDLSVGRPELQHVLYFKF